MFVLSSKTYKAIALENEKLREEIAELQESLEGYKEYCARVERDLLEFEIENRYYADELEKKTLELDLLIDIEMMRLQNLLDTI